MSSTASLDRHCIRCGEPGPFRNPAALKCAECDEKIREERKAYHREYHRARGRAIRKLIDSHEAEFRAFMAEETKGLVESPTLL